jgi:hypothetical protein
MGGVGACSNQQLNHKITRSQDHMQRGKGKMQRVQGEMYRIGGRDRMYATERYDVAEKFYNLEPGTLWERHLAKNLSFHEDAFLYSGVSLGGLEIYMKRPCALPTADLEKNKEWCQRIFCLGFEKWRTTPLGKAKAQAEDEERRKEEGAEEAKAGEERSREEKARIEEQMKEAKKVVD